MMFSNFYEFSVAYILVGSTGAKPKKTKFVPKFSLTMALGGILVSYIYTA